MFLPVSGLFPTQCAATNNGDDSYACRLACVNNSACNAWLWLSECFHCNVPMASLIKGEWSEGAVLTCLKRNFSDTTSSHNSWGVVVVALLLMLVWKLRII